MESAKKKASLKTRRRARAPRRNPEPPASEVVRREYVDDGRKVIQYSKRSEGLVLQVWMDTKKVEKFQMCLLGPLPLPMDESEKTMWRIKEGLEPRDAVDNYAEPTLEWK